MVRLFLRVCADWLVAPIVALAAVAPLIALVQQVISIDIVSVETSRGALFDATLFGAIYILLSWTCALVIGLPSLGIARVFQWLRRRSGAGVWMTVGLPSCIASLTAIALFAWFDELCLPWTELALLWCAGLTWYALLFLLQRWRATRWPLGQASLPTASVAA